MALKRRHNIESSKKNTLVKQSFIIYEKSWNTEGWFKATYIYCKYAN